MHWPEGRIRIEFLRVIRESGEVLIATDPRPDKWHGTQHSQWVGILSRLFHEHIVGSLSFGRDTLLEGRGKGGGQLKIKWLQPNKETKTEQKKRGGWDRQSNWDKVMHSIENISHARKKIEIEDSVIHSYHHKYTC